MLTPLLLLLLTPLVLTPLPLLLIPTVAADPASADPYTATTADPSSVDGQALRSHLRVSAPDRPLHAVPSLPRVLFTNTPQR